MLVWTTCILAELFGVGPHHVQVRAYVHEPVVHTASPPSELHNLDREHLQREEILKGWKELGMQPEDVGFLADADETFTRDVLRAIQVCDDIPQFDYRTHQCRHNHVKLLAVTRIYEGSPECVTHQRQGWHPELMMGHCLTHIGNASHHPPAPRERDSLLRAPGFGRRCSDWDGEDNITNGHYPLWNAADFRRTCGGTQVKVQSTTLESPAASVDHTNTSTTRRLEPYTAFHFHNFFAQLQHTRFKYRTYGHADPLAEQRPIYDLSNDLRLMYQCVMNTTLAPLVDPQYPEYTHVVGGMEATHSFWPIYFYDADYRRRRHEHVRDMIQADELYLRQEQ